ncbi:MAG: hypothetical protein H6Q55_3099 [Deltaproteobacteria bacterium]|nr:hypothetical protein [Deltaproteobacteria bacterium]
MTLKSFLFRSALPYLFEEEIDSLGGKKKGIGIEFREHLHSPALIDVHSLASVEHRVKYHCRQPSCGFLDIRNSLDNQSETAELERLREPLR